MSGCWLAVLASPAGWLPVIFRVARDWGLHHSAPIILHQGTTGCHMAQPPFPPPRPTFMVARSESLPMMMPTRGPPLRCPPCCSSLATRLVEASMASAATAHKGHACKADER